MTLLCLLVWYFKSKPTSPRWGIARATSTWPRPECRPPPRRALPASLRRGRKSWPNIRISKPAQVKDGVKKLSKLISSLIHCQPKVLILTTTTNPRTHFLFPAPTTTPQPGPGAPSTGPTTRSWTRRGTRWTCRRWWSWPRRRWGRGSFPWSVLASGPLQLRLVNQPYCKIIFPFKTWCNSCPPPAPKK